MVIHPAAGWPKGAGEIRGPGGARSDRERHAAGVSRPRKPAPAVGVRPGTSTRPGLAVWAVISSGCPAALPRRSCPGRSILLILGGWQVSYG